MHLHCSQFFILTMSNNYVHQAASIQKQGLFEHMPQLYKYQQDFEVKQRTCKEFFIAEKSDIFFHRKI